MGASAVFVTFSLSNTFCLQAFDLVHVRPIALDAWQRERERERTEICMHGGAARERRERERERSGGWWKVDHRV